MPEDTARAVGASGTTAVRIAGKECFARPLTVKELTEVERDCLKRFQRSYLETCAENIDLLPKGQRENVLREEMRAVGGWDVDNLPAKHAHDPVRVKVTRGLRKWVREQFGLDGEGDESRLQQLAAAALDQGLLTDRNYRKLTNQKPPKVKVPYVNWWITGSTEGMITLLWKCLEHNGVSRDDVVKELGQNPLLLTELSREVESLTVPAVGN